MPPTHQRRSPSAAFTPKECAAAEHFWSHTAAWSADGGPKQHIYKHTTKDAALQVMLSPAKDVSITSTPDR
jgi:hypothetical protein